MHYRPKRVMGTKEGTLSHLLETATDLDDLSVLVLDMSENKAFGISPIQAVMKFASEHRIPEVHFLSIAPERGTYLSDMIMRFASSIYPDIKVVITR